MLSIIKETIESIKYNMNTVDKLIEIGFEYVPTPMAAFIIFMIIVVTIGFTMMICIDKITKANKIKDKLIFFVPIFLLMATSIYIDEKYNFGKTLNKEISTAKAKKEMIKYQNLFIHKKIENDTFEDLLNFKKHGFYDDKTLSKVYLAYHLVPLYSKEDFEKIATYFKEIKKDGIIKNYEFMILTKKIKNLKEKYMDKLPYNAKSEEEIFKEKTEKINNKYQKIFKEAG